METIQKEQKIRPIWSNITLSILNEVKLKELIKESHRLRKENGGLKEISDDNLCWVCLVCCVRMSEKRLRNKTKREDKEEKKRGNDESR